MPVKSAAGIMDNSFIIREKGLFPLSFLDPIKLQPLRVIYFG